MHDERADAVAGPSLDDQLVLQDQIIKMEKQIEKIEAAIWKEQQPKKQFELYSRLQTYKRKLEELKSGKTFLSAE